MIRMQTGQVGAHDESSHTVCDEVDLRHRQSGVVTDKVDDLAEHGVTGINVRTTVTTAALERLAAMVEAGALKKPDIRTFELEQAGAAFQELGAGHVRGKLIVVI